MAVVSNKLQLVTRVLSKSTSSFSATGTEPEEGRREKICVSVSFTAQINFLNHGPLSDGQQRCTREGEMGKRGIIQNHFTSPHGGSNIKKVWWFSAPVFIPETSAITGLKQWRGDSLIGLFLVRDTPRPIPNALPLGISLTAEHILTAFQAYPCRVRNTPRPTEKKWEAGWMPAKGRGESRGAKEGGGY